jgi:hypothetical protein
MTNPSVKLDRRLTLMLPEVPIYGTFFDVNNSRRFIRSPRQRAREVSVEFQVPGLWRY